LPQLEVIDQLDKDGKEVDSTLYDEEGEEREEDEDVDDGIFSKLF
jgi:hypothetical protein